MSAQRVGWRLVPTGVMSGASEAKRSWQGAPRRAVPDAGEGLHQTLPNNQPNSSFTLSKKLFPSGCTSSPNAAASRSSSARCSSFSSFGTSTRTLTT